MTEHSFTLIINGDVEAHLDELYEAGCGDALFYSIDGVHYADFDREAPSLEEAVGIAVEELESLGLQVEKVLELETSSD